MVNKDVGDGHAQKQISHSKKDKIKGNTFITVSLKRLIEIMRENNGVGDGHAPKEIRHNKKNKIKGNTFITVSLKPLTEIMRENKKPGSMKNLAPTIP